MEFNWDDSPSNIARRKIGGKQGMLFLASSAARLMDKYVPADTLMLAHNIHISADEDCGHVTYNSPYAHYQYVGETDSGKKFNYSKFQHPLATDHWDKAMLVANRDELVRSYEEFMKGK